MLKHNSPNSPKNSTGKIDVEQPLMSTGTTEPGFDWYGRGNKSYEVTPKIGETIVGEQK